METRIIRVAQGQHSTLSHLYINGLFASYLLEDRIREIKIPGQTCIPTGEFRLILNKTSGMHARYLAEYPKMHKGMVEIDGLPNFDLVFFHKGNTHLDTRGCPLIAHYWMQICTDYKVLMSDFAYQQVYPKLVEQILLGNDRIVIENKIVKP
jgi:hypothetical protein